MMVVAVLADFLSVAPGGNLAAIFLMWIAGEISGVKIISIAKSPGMTIITLVLEIIWPLSLLPTWSIRTYFALRAAEAEKGV